MYNRHLCSVSLSRGACTRETMCTSMKHIEVHFVNSYGIFFTNNCLIVLKCLIVLLCFLCVTIIVFLSVS